MEKNLDRRCRQLFLSDFGRTMELESFRPRFYILFHALADEMGVSPDRLAFLMSDQHGTARLPRHEIRELFEATDRECLALAEMWYENVECKKAKEYGGPWTETDGMWRRPIWDGRGLAQDMLAAMQEFARTGRFL